MREAESMEKVNATFLKASMVNVAFFCHCYRVVRNDIQVLKCCLLIAEWLVEERAVCFVYQHWETLMKKSVSQKEKKSKYDK